jgi:precorrin-2 dehydrogenase/sirohydrochlorin ferrochelatase
VAYYPLFLELAGRSCLVVGGGPVAERKVDGLLAAGAAVTVVSPAITAGLAALVADGRIRHVARGYRPSDLAGHRLAFVATDDGALNGAVAADGRDAGVWVNAADDPAHCDFILPSVLRRGPLQIAVATGGASPALSRAIREELEAYFTDDYAALAEIVAEVRQELHARGRRPAATTWSRALDGDLRRLLAEGHRAEAKARLARRLGADPWG